LECTIGQANSVETFNCRAGFACGSANGFLPKPAMMTRMSRSHESAVIMSVQFGFAGLAPINIHLHDALYTDPADKQRHLITIHAITEETQRPVEEVVALYEEVLMQMKPQASVPDYLPVLVSKKVKQFYRRH